MTEQLAELLKVVPATVAVLLIVAYIVKLTVPLMRQRGQPIEQLSLALTAMTDVIKAQGNAAVEEQRRTNSIIEKMLHQLAKQLEAQERLLAKQAEQAKAWHEQVMNSVTGVRTHQDQMKSEGKKIVNDWQQKILSAIQALEKK